MAIIDDSPVKTTAVRTMVDAGNADYRFLQVIVFDEDGVATVVRSTNYDGTLYTPLGAISEYIQVGPQGDAGPQGVQGIQGDPGTNGTDGVDGADGQGVPVGGTAGQVLSKIDATNYNTEWTTPAPGVTDHGALTGLGDDDHTQYLNSARHSAIGGNPHNLVKGDIVLGNVDNTADVNKVIAGNITGTLGASVLADNTVSTAKLQNNAVDNTKLADMPSQTVKGRLTAGTGDPENLTVAQIKQLLGTTGNGDFARTTNTASFSIPTTYTAHPMNSTALKTAATIIDHNPVTNNSRITAVVGGKFVCSYHIVIESGTNTDRTIDSYLRINGAGIVAGSRTECYTTNAGSIQNMSVAIPILLNAGDYIEVMIRASNTLQTSVANYNSFSLEKVG